jgi:plasmid stabilization system protein ParE
VTSPLIVSREARADIRAAIDGLREVSPTLPVRFGIELEITYSLISEYPEMYPVVYREFRRALLRRFPYSVFYIVEHAVILIVGVVHQSRDDTTWKRRA